MADQRLRIVVAEDSVTVRRHLVEVLSADPGFEVVGEAANGREATELCERLRPDVVTLDMVMPLMSGLEATEYVMAHCPTPILIVSAAENRAEAFPTMEALAAGALDVLDKPTGGATDDAWSARFRSTVQLISRVRVITHPRGRLSRRAPTAPDDDARPATTSSPAPTSLVVIGMSTGGPAALKTILRALPTTFPLPIIVVLHLDRTFDVHFVEWLRTVSPLPVQHVRDRMPLPRPGTPLVLVAPADRHLVLERGLLRLVDGPARHSCRPSIDVFFESLARDAAPQTLACLLTGMGADGATGLLALRRAGATTVAQDQASSVVFGMPAAAIRMGAATRVLGLDQFSRMLHFAASATPHGLPR